MAGSVAVMINAIIRDLPQEFVSTYGKFEADKGIFAVLNVIIGINGLFEWYIGYRWFDFRFFWGYNLAKAYK